MNVLILEHHQYAAAVQVGSHQIAHELLRRGHQVTWLRHPRSLVHRLTGRLPPPLVVHPDGLREVALRTLAPFLDLPLLGSAWWGRRWLAGTRRQLARAGVGGSYDLLWLSDFTAISLLSTISAERVVMRFFDHVESYRWMPQSLFRLIGENMDRADLVLASSRVVQADLIARGIDCRYLPNGIDVDRIPSAQSIRADRPRRVIYVGALEEWFDLPTVEHWARGLPEVRFDLVGPNRLGLHSELPNLHFVGPVPYEEVPDLLLRASCGIIPFRLQRLTRGVHPLKLYEYLAAGCPVLSADLPEVRADGTGIFKYSAAADGLEVLSGILDRPVDREALRRRVLDQGWDRRLDQVGELLGCPL